MGSVVLPHLGKLYFHTDLLITPVGVQARSCDGSLHTRWELAPHPHSFHSTAREALTNLMTVTGWHVDQAIMSEDERLVIIRFGRDWDPDCMRQDEVLYRESFPSAFLCFY
jgi:hypothetical protein